MLFKIILESSLFIAFAFIAFLGIASNSLAQSGAVRVVPSSVMGSVTFEDIPIGADDSPSACVDEKVINTYYQGSPEKYNATFSPMIQCLSGQMNATVLNTQISSIEAAIGEINDRLTRVAEMTAYFKSFSKDNINNLSFVAIPVGEISQKTNKKAENIIARCIKTPGESVGGIYGVGTPGSFTSAFFDNASSKALEALKKFIEDNKTISSTLGTTIGINEILKMKKLAELSKNNQKVIEENFILVANKNSNENNYISSSFSWILLNGERHLARMAWVIRKTLLPFAPKLPDQLTHMSLSAFFSLNGMIDGISNKNTLDTKYSVFLPEANIFLDIQVSINKHVGDYKSMKSNLEVEKDILSAQLRNLVIKNYNCIKY